MICGILVLLAYIMGAAQVIIIRNLRDGDILDGN